MPLQRWRLLDRPDSTPGDKDRQEIMALLAQGIDPAEAVAVIHDASTRTPTEIDRLLADAFRYLGDLSLDQDQRRQLRRIQADWRGASRQLLDDLAPTDPEHDPSRPTRERPGPGLGLR